MKHRHATPPERGPLTEAEIRELLGDAPRPAPLWREALAARVLRHAEPEQAIQENRFYCRKCDANQPECPCPMCGFDGERYR